MAGKKGMTHKKKRTAKKTTKTAVTETPKMTGTEAPKATETNNAAPSFDQIAQESQARISQDLKTPPKRDTKASESVSGPVSSGSSPTGPNGPASIGAIYQPTIVKSIVSNGVQTVCNSRAELTKIETWKVTKDEAEAVGQSFDHLLQVWFPQLGSDNPKIQTALTFLMTTGYVFGSRILAEQKIRAEVERRLQEEKNKADRAKEPEKQPPGAYQDTMPVSTEGMQ